MDNFTIFGVQVAMTFVSCYLIAKFYVWPKLLSLPQTEALKALVATNIFRQLGLVFLVSPQVVGSTVPRSWTEPVAYGDLIVVILAMLAFVGLAKRQSWAMGITWLFNVVGFVDLISAFITGASAQAWNFEFRSAWYITTFLAPAFLTVHSMIFLLLLRKPSGSAK